MSRISDKIVDDDDRAANKPQPKLKFNPDHGYTTAEDADIGMLENDRSGKHFFDIVSHMVAMSAMGAGPGHESARTTHNQWESLRMAVLLFCHHTYWETMADIDELNLRILPYYAGIELSWRGTYDECNVVVLQFDRNELYQKFMDGANKVIENQHPTIVGQWRCSYVEAPMIHKILTEFTQRTYTIKAPQ